MLTKNKFKQLEVSHLISNIVYFDYINISHIICSYKYIFLSVEKCQESPA